MSFKTCKNVIRSAMSGLLAAGLMLGGLTAPSAMAGGGSGSGDGGGGSLAADFFWQYKDDTTGSWGSASDFSSVEAAFRAANVTLVNSGGDYNGIDKAKAALQEAKAECESGFNARHPDEAGRADCRVVAVGAGYTTSTRKFDGSAIQAAQWWKNLWYATAGNAASTYRYNGTQQYQTSTPFTDDPTNSVDKLMEKAVTDTTTIAIIVLDKYQPAPPNYTLSITTNQQSAGVKAGTSGVVRDVIHASNNGSSIVESVDAEVILHYKGQAQGYAAKEDFSARLRLGRNDNKRGMLRSE